jgi:hypothetical protein
MKRITTRHEDCEECNKLVEKTLETLRQHPSWGINTCTSQDAAYSHTATVLR